MPSCNLAKTVHNKWLQQSGNRGNDLYVATVDDLVRAFMQMVRYYQFLKGENAGTRPGKEELLFRVAQRSTHRTGNPKVLADAISNIRGVQDFVTREPHLEGEEVFGSQKWKADMPLGCEHDSHRPDKVNFSRPRVRTRSAIASTSTPAAAVIEEGIPFPPGTDDMETMPSDEHEDHPRSNHPMHVTGIQETECNEREWHMSRLPKSSAKACFAQQAVTKKKCTARIVQNNVPTAAPTYTGLMVNYKKNRNDVMQFFFCNDDIERCVKGTKRKWVLSVPEIPAIWPVKRGTNLSKHEILALEAAGFQLPQRQAISPRRLFGDHCGIHLLSSYPVPDEAHEHPKIRGGKRIRRNPKSPTTMQANNSISARTLTARIERVTMVPHPGFGCIVSLVSGKEPRAQKYTMSISSFPSCTCPYFEEMILKSLGGRGQWAYCKHMYYIFAVICGLDGEVEPFLHAPSFSFNEVKRVLLSGILVYVNSP